MKKFLLILAAIAAVFFAWLYLFIPAKITVQKSLTIEANRSALYRKLGDSSTWKQWWPGTNDETGTFYLNKLRIRPGPARTLSVPLMIADKQFETTAEMTLMPLLTDSTIIYIESVIA